jgi:hypothetical protein
MGVTVDWYDERQTIVLYKFVGKWGWEEFHQCWNWVNDQMNQTAHPVSVLMDLSASNHVPADALVHMRSVSQQVNKHYSGATAFVGTGALGKVYYSLMSRLSPQMVEKFRLFFVDTIEEAIQKLDEFSSKGAE